MFLVTSEITDASASSIMLHCIAPMSEQSIDRDLYVGLDVSAIHNHNRIAINNYMLFNAHKVDIVDDSGVLNVVHQNAMWRGVMASHRVLNCVVVSSCRRALKSKSLISV